MAREIKLRIVLQNPIDGLMYGLQKGKGTGYEIVQAQLGKSEDLAFDFPRQLKQPNRPGISLNGPFFQGPAKSRFVYINIGSYAGQAGAPWNGRLKVPLLKAELPDSLWDDFAHVWQCTVPGRTEGGRPAFATVKPFSGWTIRTLSG